MYWAPDAMIPKGRTPSWVSSLEHYGLLRVGNQIFIPTRMTPQNFDYPYPMPVPFWRQAENLAAFEAEVLGLERTHCFPGDTSITRADGTFAPIRPRVCALPRKRRLPSEARTLSSSSVLPKHRFAAGIDKLLHLRGEALAIG